MSADCIGTGCAKATLLERIRELEAERDALLRAGAALVAAVGTRECTLPEVVAMYAALDAARKGEGTDTPEGAQP